MTYKTITYEKLGSVGILTLNTPASLNALTELQMTEVEDALDAASSDEALGALILTGAGNAFCVGVNFDMLDRAFEDIGYFEGIVRRVSGIAARIEELPIPTVAAINGVARAAGFELSLACDFILIADNAKCGDVHTNVGVIPGAGSLRLARRVGEQRAKELIWSARWWSAEEAVAAGYAWKAVPAASLRDETVAFAGTMADKPRATIVANKRVFQRGLGASLEAGVEMELRNFVEYMGSSAIPRENYVASRQRWLARKPKDVS